MLAMVDDEEQNHWDLQLPHVESAHNNSVSAATGLSPNEVHMDRLPRLPLTVFDPPNVGGHPSLKRGYLAYIDLATAPQKTRLPRRPGTSRHQRIASQPPQRPHHVRPPPISSVHHRRFGVDLQLRSNQPPTYQETHRRHRAEDQALLQLDIPLQDSRRRLGTGLRHPRWSVPSEQIAIVRPSLRRAWTRLQTPRLRSSMQAVREPRRHSNLP